MTAREDDHVLDWTSPPELGPDVALEEPLTLRAAAVAALVSLTVAGIVAAVALVSVRNTLEDRDRAGYLAACEAANGARRMIDARDTRQLDAIVAGARAGGLRGDALGALELSVRRGYTSLGERDCTAEYERLAR